MERDGEVQRGFRITGRVQGVGFRWWTRQTAGGLGVRGWVRNCRDGAVEVHAAADEPTLDRLRALLARGPASARVERVEAFELETPVDRRDFGIVG